MMLHVKCYVYVWLYGEMLQLCNGAPLTEEGSDDLALIDEFNDNDEDEH